MEKQLSTAIDPDEAVSAFFESDDASRRAEANLKKAGFGDEVIYVVPRAPGVTVTVAEAARLEEAAKILKAAGGEMREADVNASGSVMFRLAPGRIAPGEGPDAGDSPAKRTEDEDGAGTATGGAIF